MRKGFTLIELLIVIAILAVLSVTVVLVLNPAELLRQSRDTTRLSDLATINNAIALYLSDGNTAWSTACNLTSTASPTNWPSLCGSPLVNSSTTVGGAGWVKVNFSLISAGAPLSRLPIDPVNGPCTSNGTPNETCQYAYSANASLGQYKIVANLESSKYYANMQNDGGIDNTGVTALYEIGSNLTLNP